MTRLLIALLLLCSTAGAEDSKVLLTDNPRREIQQIVKWALMQKDLMWLEVNSLKYPFAHGAWTIEVHTSSDKEPVFNYSLLTVEQLDVAQCEIIRRWISENKKDTINYDVCFGKHTFFIKQRGAK